MNKKNAIVALLLTASCANSVSVLGASNGVSQTYLRNIILSIRPDPTTWAELSSIENSSTTIPWGRILSGTHFAARMGINELVARGTGAIYYMSATVPVGGGSGLGPTINCDADPSIQVSCVLHSSSGLAILPTNTMRQTITAFQMNCGSSALYSAGPIFGGSNTAPGGTIYHLLCLTTLNGTPVSVGAGGLGNNWVH